MFQVRKAESKWQPPDQEGEQSETADTGDNPPRVGMESSGAEPEHEHRSQDIKKAENETECAAEAADNFCGVGFPEIWVEDAEADGEAIQGKSHHRHDRAEKGDTIPRHAQEVRGKRDQ